MNARRQLSAESPGSPLACAWRAPSAWLTVAIGGWLAVALSRVVPYLPQSGGDFENLHRGAASLVAGGSAFSRPELDYPPLVPVLLAPLGWLDLAVARQVWFALSILAIASAMVLLFRLAGRDSAAATAVAVVLAVEGSSVPNLGLGQVHPLLLLILAGALIAFERHPGRAAGALGLAAALKIWPGLLYLAFVTASQAARWRAARAAAVAALLLVALPFGLLVAATPPPHLPLAHGYWLGTPAMLNFSAPAAVLRASYGWQPGSRLPADWVEGVTAAWRLAPGGQRISVTVSLLVLATGLLAIHLRLARRPALATGPAVASALVALALVAAPISWYHYQLLQLPAFVLALAAAVRARRWLSVVALGTLLAVLTHHEWLAAAWRLVRPDPATALYLTGICLPLLGAVWFVSRLFALGAGAPAVRTP